MASNYDAKLLGRLLADNIMAYHDTEDYAGMELNTRKLIRAMGYDNKTAKTASALVKEIYLNYDAAQAAFEVGKLDIERKHYERARHLASKADARLRTDYDTRLLVDVVYHWRHKARLKAISTIWLNWMQKTRNDLVKATACTIHMINAAFAHDERNYDKFKNEFTLIYEIIILTSPRKMPLLF